MKYFANIAVSALLVCNSQAAERHWTIQPLSIDSRQDLFWCDDTYVAGGRSSGSFPHPPMYFEARKSDSRVPVQILDDTGTPMKIRITGCEAGHIIAEGPHLQGRAVEANVSALYMIPIGGTSKLLAAPKDRVIAGDSKLVSIPGKNIVEPMPRIAVPEGGYVLDKECATFADEDFRLVCMDVWFGRVFVLRNFIISDYLWQSTAAARHPGGEIGQVNHVLASRGCSNARVWRGWRT